MTDLLPNARRVKLGDKGVPPKREETETKNLSVKPDIDDKEDRPTIHFGVDGKLKKEMQKYAVDIDKSLKEMLIEAYYFYKAAHPAPQ